MREYDNCKQFAGYDTITDVAIAVEECCLGDVTLLILSVPRLKRAVAMR